MQNYRAQNVAALIRIQKMLETTVTFGYMLWSKALVCGFEAGEKER
jgi:hypothetical protein